MKNFSVGTLSELSDDIRVSADESVSAMLFDLYGWEGSLDDYPPAADNFGKGKVMKLSSLEEAVAAGITTDILYGVPYYHIKCFFDLAGSDAGVYVAIADCHSDFSILDDIARLSGYTVFQAGIWTEQPLWTQTDESACTPSPFLTALAAHLQKMSEAVVSDISVVVSGGRGEESGSGTDLTVLPDLTSLRQPRLSVVLGQPTSDDLHTMQHATSRLTPPGMIGRVMALLTLLPAEDSIGSVMKGDLNKAEDIDDAEIGFGKTSDDYTPVGDITDNLYRSLAEKAYIMPLRYDGIETGLFLSGDPTATRGDVNTISLARVLRKAKRIVLQALLPYINADWHANGGLSKAAQAEINGAVSESLAARLLCADKGTLQAESITVTVDPSTTLLSDDGISLSFAIIPLGQEKEIHLRERSEFPIDN